MNTVTFSKSTDKLNADPQQPSTLSNDHSQSATPDSTWQTTLEQYQKDNPHLSRLDVLQIFELV